MTRSVNAQRTVPCMPPLMEEETIPLNREAGDTKFGGTACENIVKAYFLSKSINIAEPNVDDGVYARHANPDAALYARNANVYGHGYARNANGYGHGYLSLIHISEPTRPY